MTERTTEGTQKIAADGDAVATAQNILAHERAFRGSLVCEIVMLNCDVVLALALYALLKPVNSTLALLGSFWRIANAGMLGVGVAASLVALDLFSNPNYMSLLSGSQLHPLALLFFDLHDRLSLIGLMFFCFGAGVHSWLLYQSSSFQESYLGSTSSPASRCSSAALPSSSSRPLELERCLIPPS